MKNIIILSVFICLIYFPGAAAQDHPDTLTLEQAIIIALKNNPGVQVARAEIKKSEYYVDENKAGLLPSVSGKAHYIYAPENGYDPAVTNGGEYGLQISADYTIYNGGLNHLTIDKANTDVSLSQLTLERAKSDLIYNVRSVYYAINHLEREVEYRKEAFNSLNDYYRYLKESETGGNTTHSDVLKTEVELNNAKIDLNDAEHNLEKVKKELNNLLFLPQHAGFKHINPAAIDTTVIQAESPDNLPALKLAETEALINHFDIQSARAEKLPVISLNGDAGILGVKPDNYNSDLGYSAAVDVNIPIFTWGKVNSKIERATVTYEQSMLRMKMIRKNLMLTQDSLLTEFKLTLQKMNAYKENIKTAEENFYYSKALFIGGSGSTLEVLNAFTLLNEVKTNYNNSILNLQVTKAELLKLFGR